MICRAFDPGQTLRDRFILVILSHTSHSGLAPGGRTGYRHIVAGSGRRPSTRYDSKQGSHEPANRQRCRGASQSEFPAEPGTCDGREGPELGCDRLHQVGHRLTGAAATSSGPRIRPRPTQEGRDDRQLHTPEHWSALMDDGPSTGRSIWAGPPPDGTANEGSR